MKLLLLKLFNFWQCTIHGLSMSVSEKLMTYIGIDTRILNPKNILLNKCIIGKHCYLAAQTESSRITIGKGSNIGMYCMIAACNSIDIGQNVLLGPNVYIADYNHEYRNIDLPVSKQGRDRANNCISIGDDGWIGKNVVIVGNVRIGKHCVIGANSVVNHDLPPFSVCVGNPCVPIKIWNGKEWAKI